MQGPSDSERLDAIVAEAAKKHGFRLEVDGWARKTYDLYIGERKRSNAKLVARLETFAMTSGEVRVFDDKALPFAQEVGEALEKAFGVKEAVIIRVSPPE